MADAPSTSTYVLISSDSNNLPNCRQLGALDGIVIGDTGPGGFALIGPSNFLGSLQDLSTLGFVARTNVDTAAVRTLTSDSSILITNPQGTAADPHFRVVANSTVQNVILAVDGVDQTTQGRLNFIGQGTAGVTVVYNGGLDAADITISGSAAPSDATYIIQTPSDSLSHEQALSLLDTGIMKSTTGTGVVSIAQAGVDYQEPNANLTAIAGLSPSQGGIIVGTSGGSYTMRAVGTNNQVPVSNGTDWSWTTVPGGGAPTTATYVTTSANGVLSNEFSLGDLTNGLLKISVSAAIATPSTAVPGIDYYLPAIPTRSPCTLYESANSNLIAIGGNYSGVGGSGNILIGKDLGVTNAATGNIIIGLGAFPNDVFVTTVTVVGNQAGPSLTAPPTLNNAGSFGTRSVFSQDDMYLIGNAARTCINYSNPNTITVQPYALQLGSDSGSILPQVFMLGSANPTPANIPVNAGVFSVSTDGEPRYSNSNGVFPIVISADTIPIAQGGTGQTTQAAALNALGVFSGTATLTGGSVVVSNANIKTGSKITLTYDIPVTPGFLSAPLASIIDSTSFVINSTSGTDASTVTYIFTQS